MTNGELIIYLSATAHIKTRCCFIYLCRNSFMSSQNLPRDDENLVEVRGRMEKGKWGVFEIK
jgi:hypothetical protein